MKTGVLAFDPSPSFMTIPPVGPGLLLPNFYVLKSTL